MEQGPTRGVVLGGIFLAAWVVIGTAGFELIEDWGVIDSFYMTLITISTVGFREVHPLSQVGKLFASFLIVGGLTTALYTFTRLGQVVLEGELLGFLGRRRMQVGIAKLKDHVIVCGYGRIGRPATEALRRNGVPFCVIDRSAEVADFARGKDFPFLVGDATDEDLLKDAGVERARALLALLPSDADNLYLTMSAKAIKPGITVIARARDDKAETKLKRGGADRVVSPYQIAAMRVVQAAMNPNVVDLLELVTHPHHLDLSLGEFIVTDASPLSGRSLAETSIRTRYGVFVVGIKRPSGEVLYNPDSPVTIHSGDTVVGFGKAEDLARLGRDCQVRG